MKKLLPLMFLLCGLTGCHTWVGKTQDELVRKLGQPESIGKSGEYQVLAYHEEITWDSMDWRLSDDQLRTESIFNPPYRSSYDPTCFDQRCVRNRGISWHQDTKSAYERFWIDKDGIVRKRTFKYE